MKNREIKFKAWSKQQNKFISGYPIGYDKPNGFELCGVNQGGEGDDETTEDGAVLLQYTGLKDKNGKEIYEGDILHGREEGNGETTEWTDVYYIVFFKDGAFYIRENNIDESSGWCDLLDSNDILDYYEIVGNIYENAVPLAATKKIIF